ncbi:hypothetical protein [Psychrobacillus antarcticus]|uniref:hypothetical protein n=1 Tax=Psychrobacillus antarcticus TaxID=2879115 RepID=UPI0024079D2E|nr:hypothetical protein [Psychrobacillus antarcticus]
MKFIKQPNTVISRTLYETDFVLFRTLLDSGNLEKTLFADNRQLVMLAIGILNRTLNLEEFLVAVVGQKWKFHRKVEIGETLSVAYQIQENKTLGNKRYIYDIKIELIVEEHVVATGIWGVMLNNKV